MIALLNQLNVDALIINDPVDIFYFTKVKISLGHLIIEKDCLTLYVDGRYFEKCQKQALCAVKLFDETQLVAHVNSFKKVGFDSHFWTVDIFSKNKKRFQVDLVPIASPTKMKRVIKTKEEISLMKKAASLNKQAIEYAFSLLKEEITEKEIALEFECFAKKHGAEDLSFATIVAFGRNSSRPHHETGDTRLKKGDIVLIDCGVSYNKYQSDMTRCMFFGDPDPKLQEFYEIVKKAQKKAIEMCRPGIVIQDLDKAAREFISSYGYEKLFCHGLGHGVGLLVHEYPAVNQKGSDSLDILQENMVITIEPGIYEPGLGGVRYEDTILITKNGYENFYE